MTEPDMLAALEPVIDALEALGVEYSICGSGVARSTVDADLVADLRGGQVDALAARLEHDYYIDRDAAPMPYSG